MRKVYRPIVAWGILAQVTLLAPPTPPAAASPAPRPPFVQRLPVRPFPQNVEWINSRPLDLRELRNRFVLLDFWTLGCINCMHQIPELKRLEKTWQNELVVIGVHSGKFAGEKVTRSIREASRRYGVEHPVVNDSQFAIWNSFGIQAWPSLVLIDPEGYAVWGHSGEATYEQIDAVLRRAAPYYRVARLLDNTPLALAKSSEQTATVLRFPGKILADQAGQRLFIADSGHHRIIVTQFDGKLLATIGSGTAGRADGDYANAQFDSPQGLALLGDNLYVADTWNHSIRKIDLAAQRVSTIAGNGRQNREALPFTSRRPLATALSSPWDVLIHKDTLFIAMAGLHQLWSMRLDGSAISVYAGTGIEDIVDGPIKPRRLYQPGFAAMAQPSGLTSDGTRLYVADSEGSSIRALRLDAKGDMQTVVGTAHLPAARLFAFGDVDGRGNEVRLQHPLGVAWYEGRLYVADTYNHKIKVIDPVSGQTRTLVGSKLVGMTDEPPTFNEPGGIAAADGKLVIADTNNHAIRVIDLRNANRVNTLSIKGLAPP